MILKRFELLFLAMFMVIASGCGGDKDQMHKDTKDSVNANTKNGDDQKQAAEPTDREKFEKGTVEYLAMSEELNTLLADIVDVESAEKAVPKLKEFGKKGKELEQRMKPKGQPLVETKKYLEEKYRDRLKNTQESLFKQVQRLREKQDVWSIVEAAMAPSGR
jgi:hypothetical protein